METLLKDLAKAVADLQETVRGKFSSADPVAANAEKDALVQQVRDLQEQMKNVQRVKAIQKKAWVVGGQKPADGVEGKSFASFMKAVINKDMDFLAEMKTANGQSEGTAADGGIAVPVEYANEIVKLERQNSIARNICRIFPMGSLTRKVPRQLTNPTVTWTTEGTNHTKTKTTLEQITQTAKKVSALVPFTEELLEDNNVNFDQFLFQLVSEAIGREEDRVAFAGNGGGGDPFYGVLYATGVNSVTMDGASLSWTDIVNAYMAPKAPYRSRGVWVLGSDALKLVMKLKDDENRPIWSLPTDGAPGKIWGKDYYETDQLTTTILFGAFNTSLWLSDRGSYDVKASDSASDASGGAGSAFLQDEIWYKFRKREDITVAQPEAFAKMTVA